jgi:hypothetical protein
MPILWTRNLRLHLIVSGHPLELALMGRQHLHTGEPPRETLHVRSWLTEGGAREGGGSQTLSVHTLRLTLTNVERSALRLVAKAARGLTLAHVLGCVWVVDLGQRDGG